VDKIESKNLDLLSYCGLYCGACPSYHLGTCLGCRSENKNQKRTSKWSCKIRLCCKDEKELFYCGKCSEFPCIKISNKLINSHPNDLKFTYRHEIPNNVENINTVGFYQWIKAQKNKWKCDTCGGPIVFYNYTCIKCNKNYKPELMDYKKVGK